jgi:hypothetical protein
MNLEKQVKKALVLLTDLASFMPKNLSLDTHHHGKKEAWRITVEKIEYKEKEPDEAK